jgi:polar amino acid transport system substrate-binding protein
VAFSEPYFVATQTIALPAANTKVSKMDDLKP